MTTPTLSRTSEHDILPGFSRGGPEQNEHRLGERLEVVVAVDGRVVVQGDFAENLGKTFRVIRMGANQTGSTIVSTCMPMTA